MKDYKFVNEFNKEVKFYLIENPEHINFFHGKEVGVDEKIIAFSVRVKLELEKKGMIAYYPDDLLDLPDWNTEGINNSKNLSKALEYIEEEFGRILQKFGYDKIPIFLSLFFTWKVAYDSLFTLNVVLEKLIDKFPDATFYYFANNNSLKDLFSLSYSSNIIGVVSKLLSYSRNSFREIEYKVEYKKKSIMEFLNLFIRFKEILFGLSFLNLKKRKVMILNNSHDVAYLEKTILRDMADRNKTLVSRNFLLFFSKDKLRLTYFSKHEANNSFWKEYLQIQKKLLANKEFNSLFPSLEFSEFFTKGIFGEVQNELQGWIENVHKLKVFFLKSKFEYIISSVYRFAVKETFIALIAKLTKIKLVVYQEGGGIGYLNWPMINQDFIISDYFLSYGEGIGISPYLKDLPSKKINIGSLRIAEIRKKYESVNKISISEKTEIYFIPDNFKSTPFQHYPYNGGIYYEAHRFQFRILEVFLKHPEIQFVIKTLKGKEWLYERFLSYGNIRLETKPIEKILHLASGFILESPTTSLLECLITDLPILLFYNPSGFKLEPNAEKLLSKRIRITSNPDLFSGTISSLLADIKEGNEMTMNKEFENLFSISSSEVAIQLKDFFTNENHFLLGRSGL